MLKQKQVILLLKKFPYLEKLEESLPQNHTRIDVSDFQTIIIQLMALKLITTDVAKDYGVYTYWVLTPYGRSEMVKLKAIKR